MDENYLITIKGTMEQDGHSDSVELMTHGSFLQRDGSFYIIYKETEATGYDGCTTTVKISEDARRVAMLRYGKAQSQLVIEKGYGAVSLGVAADEIEHELSSNGGHVKFSYTLDSGSEDFISRNLVDINVTPLPQPDSAS